MFGTTLSGRSLDDQAVGRGHARAVQVDHELAAPDRNTLVYLLEPACSMPISSFPSARESTAAIDRDAETRAIDSTKLSARMIGRRRRVQSNQNPASRLLAKVTSPVFSDVLLTASVSPLSARLWIAAVESAESVSAPRDLRSPT
jgi:hypothetical protein